MKGFSVPSSTDKVASSGPHPITFDRFIRVLLVVVAVVGMGVLIYYLSAVLLPFFVAWMVAYLLSPVVRFFQFKCRLRSRFASIFLTLGLTVGLLAAFFYLVVPPMMDEMVHLKEVTIRYIRQGASNHTIPPALEAYLQRHASQYEVEKLLQQEDVVNALRTTVPKVWEMLMSTAGLVINIVASLIGLLYLLFLLSDYEKYANGWIHYVPRSKRRFVAQLVSDIQHGMAGYFRGQALIALSNCVMFSIGFALIGFPVPVGLGCLIGVISFVPYLQVIGFIPATLMALLTAAETGRNFWLLLGLVLAVYLVVQVLQDTIFTPRIMGRIMGLPPAIVLLALSVWGYALGLIGLIIALPVTTLVMSYYRRYVVGDDTPLPRGISEEEIAVEKEAGVYVAPDDSDEAAAASVSAPEASRQSEP